VNKILQITTKKFVNFGIFGYKKTASS